MPFNSNHFLHPDDSAALQALKSIPGFTSLMKGFMKEFSERSIKLRCLSSYVRLGEDQLPRYKEMLKPICEKLGIPVPELYLMMDVRPNAFTTGENEAFIVLTTGLLETIPERLIPTVLAHECGHIACHHVLYRTMGNILFGTVSGGLNLLPLGGLFLIIFCALPAAWGIKNFFAEVNTGKGFKVPEWSRYYLFGILPLLIIFLFCAGFSNRWF
jgi:Zn-dependent protease with chaperone function